MLTLVVRIGLASISTPYTPYHCLPANTAAGLHFDSHRYYLWIHCPDAGLANASIISVQERLCELTLP